MITIDIETKSDKDITKCGVYAYADSPYYDILLFAYSVDGQPVQVVDTASGEKLPTEILKALADEKIVKRAFNVNFERVCLSRYLQKNYPQYFQSYSINEDTVSDYLNPEGWQCTMIHSRTLGLPSSLAEVGTVLGIEQQKMTEGKALIKFFVYLMTRLTVFLSSTPLLIIPTNGKLSRRTTNEMLKLKWKLTRNSAAFLFPIFCGRNFTLTRR